MNFRKVVTIVVGTLLLAVSLSGCGAAGRGSSNNSTAGASGITIGVPAAFSGAESFIGPRFLNGVKVAVDQINKNGGIMGQKLSVATADTAGDPVDAVPAITQLVGTKHPAALIGPSSLTIMAVVNQLNQDHIVDVTLGGTTQLDKMNFPYIFRTSPSDSQMGVAMAYYGINKGYKRAALVFGSNDSAQTLDGPVQNTLKAHGASVAIDVKVVPDQSSYRSEIERVVAAHPDSLYIQFDPQTASTFFTEWKQLGAPAIPVIGSDVTAAGDFIKAITPQVASQMLTSIQGSTAGGPAAEEYAKFYGEVFNGQKPITLSNNAYDAMNIIALAMLEAKSTNPEKYMPYVVKVANGPGEKVYDFKSGAAAIAAGKSINYEGAGGPCDFDQYHNVTGAFQAVQSDQAGNLKTVATITPQELLGY